MCKNELLLEGVLEEHVEVKYPWILTLALGLAFLLGSYDITALNLALVWIQKDLSLSLWNIDWVMNAYLITFASFLIPFGRLSDIYGHKLFFLLGTGLVALSSLFCGLSQTAMQLILARGLQGFATALCWPGIQSITMQIFPKNQVAKVLGVVIALGGVGMVFGPIISGFLIDILSWRAVLFLNIPFALTAFFIVAWILPSHAFPKKHFHVDLIGLALLVCFSFSLVYAIDLGGKTGFVQKQVYGFLAASVGLLWLFIVREDNVQSPLIDLPKLHSKDFIIGVIYRSAAAFAFITFLFLTSYALQHIAIIESEHAGLYFIPFTLMFAIFSYVGGHLAKHFGSSRMMYLGFWLLGLGLVSYAITIQFSLTFLAILTPFICMGTGLGLFLTNNTVFSIHSLPKSHWGVAIGILYMMNLIASSIAIIIASYLMKTPGYNIVVQLLKAKNIDLSEFKLTLLQAVMRGVHTIPDTLLQFSENTKEVYLAIKAGFLYAMGIDLGIAAALIFIPMWIYLAVQKLHKNKIS